MRDLTHFSLLLIVCAVHLTDVHALCLCDGAPCHCFDDRPQSDLVSEFLFQDGANNLGSRRAANSASDAELGRLDLERAAYMLRQSGVNVSAPTGALPVAQSAIQSDGSLNSSPELPNMTLVIFLSFADLSDSDNYPLLRMSPPGNVSKACFGTDFTVLDMELAYQSFPEVELILCAGRTIASKLQMHRLYKIAISYVYSKGSYRFQKIIDGDTGTMDAPLDLLLIPSNPLFRPIDTSAVLQLGAADSTYGYSGLVKYIALYRRAFSAAEIQQVTNMSLPNSIPVTDTSSVTVNEDQLSLINISASDFDGDSLVMQVLTLPLKGNLSFFNTTAGEYSLIPYAPFYVGTGASPLTVTLAYLSEPNENGLAVTSFSYRAHDDRLWSRNGTLAQVAININPTNDPPQATNQEDPPVKAFVKQERQIILSGTDPIDDEVVVGAEVVRLPNFGELCLTSSCETTITAVPATVNFATGVWYRSRAISETAAGLSPAGSVLEEDSFLFVVLDAAGSRSDPGIVRIDVIPGVFATDSTEQAVEDQRLTFGLTGRDDRNQSLSFYVWTLPSRGSIYQVGSAGPITEDELPALVTGSNSTIEYQGFEHEFIKRDGTPDIFKFFALSADGRASPTGDIQLFITSVNDQFVLESSTNSLKTFVNADPDKFRPEFSVFILDVDPVKDTFVVTIETGKNQSAVSLNFDQLAIVGRRIEGDGAFTWIEGDGVTDQRMVFESSREVLNEVMVGMTYYSSTAGTDVITFTAIDDNSGTILSTLTPLYITCEVDVNPDTQADAESIYEKPALWISLLPVMGIPLLCMCLCIGRQLYYVHLRRSRDRVEIPQWLECLCQGSSYDRIRSDEPDLYSSAHGGSSRLSIVSDEDPEHVTTAKSADMEMQKTSTVFGTDDR